MPSEPRLPASARSAPLRAAALAASLVPALAGLVASAALLVDYTRPAPVFCAEGSACDDVRHTIFAAPWGVPMPAVGLAGFLAIGVVSLLAGRRARAAQLALALVAALVGASLFVIQVLMGSYCPYCCVADASGTVSLLVALWRFFDARDAAAPSWASLAGAGSLAVAVAVPLVAGYSRKSPGPSPAITAEIARTPKGEVTVVDFVDFECPFCRMTNAEFTPLLEAYKDKVRVVRRQVPLRSHAHALDAARAACCGERLGKGDALADALFAAPVDDLTREGCEKVALSVGIELEPYRACVGDPKTDEQIEADRAEFKESGGYALPTIWIGERRLVGAQPREALAKALEQALARAGG
jgi:predicted DsbA family dithiol-disulfide isomerase/uncharacterized membrane protein